MAKAVIEHDEKTGAKERIMDAAEQLFADSGFAATSVGQIAEAAGANRALLYYYFRDKQDLYCSIVARGIAQVLGLISDVSASSGSALERLERFVHSYYALLMKRHQVARIVFREMTGTGEKLGINIDQSLRDVMHRTSGIIQQGLNDGEFEGVDPELAAVSLFGMIHVFFTQGMATGRGFPTKVVVTHTLSLFRHGAEARRRTDGRPVRRAAKRSK